MHAPHPKTPLQPKRTQLAPCTVGSANAPVIMGPTQSSNGHAPEVADYSRPPLDEDRRTMALVTSQEVDMLLDIL